MLYKQDCILGHLLVGSIAFEFYEQNQSVFARGQHLLYCRHRFSVNREFLYLLQCHFLRFFFDAGNTVEGSVMVQDIVTVFCPLYIYLASVCSEFASSFKTRNGVLRPFAASATVSDDLHARIHREQFVKLIICHTVCNKYSDDYYDH